MRVLAHLILVAVIAGPVLAACSSLPDLDSLEIFDSKKKLAGDRKPVFPEGVPGVSSGVPPELVKGYREPESGMVDPAKAAAEAAAESDPKPKPPPPRIAAVKPKPKPKPAAQTQGQARAAAPQPAPTQAAWPAPQQPPPAQAAWPAPQPQAAWPGSR